MFRSWFVAATSYGSSHGSRPPTTTSYGSSHGVGHPLLPPTGPVTGVDHPLLPQRPRMARLTRKVCDDVDGVTRGLGCFCACALGRHAPRWRRQMTSRATRPRVTPPLTTNLHRPPQIRNPLTKPPGGSQQRLKEFSTSKVRRWSKKVSIKPGSGPCDFNSTQLSWSA